MKDTTNKFMVSVSGGSFDRIAILCPVVGSIAKEDAINLAAWLLALALNPNDDIQFTEYLDKVRGT